MTEARRQLVLLGGGHAHLSLLQGVATRAPAGWRVTLISPSSRQIYSGMLPGWVAGHYGNEDCSISLTGLCARARLSFHETAATALDLKRGEVACADGRKVPFDLLSVDTGAEPALAGLPGAVEHALPVRPIEGFVARWPAIVDRWRAREAPFDVVVIGGGAAAVELAFAVWFRATHGGGSRVRVSLVGPDELPLAGSAPGVRHRVARALAERGIRWRGNRMAARILPGQIGFDRDETMPFDACLVATGAAAPRWPSEAGLACDERGFIRVDRWLRSVSHPRVFAAGDVAALVDARPKSGVYAVRAGPVLAENILATCAGRALSEWQPQRSALYLISTGNHRAIASWGDWSAAGRWPWWWKNSIDRRFVRRFSA